MRDWTSMTLVGLMGIILFVMAGIPASVLGEVPQQINYQGTLTDDIGNPLDGDFSMTFAIYATAGGITPLWTETQTVPVINGVYNLVLGQPGNEIDLTVIDGERFLGISVESDAEMTPRQPITASAFAIKAAKADTVADGAITTPMIADDAITSAKIVNDSLTALDLAANSVNASEISTDAVGSLEIATGAVKSLEIADGAVTAVDLAEDYVNTSGDTMNGDLEIDGQLFVNKSLDGFLTEIATGEKYLISPTRTLAVGIDLAVEDSGYVTMGLSSNVKGGYLFSNGISTSADGYQDTCGLYAAANSSNGPSHGAILDSYVLDDGNQPAYGLQSTVYQYGYGDAYGLYSKVYSGDTSGSSYAGYFEVQSGSTTGEAYAGYFDGHVHVSGTLTKTAGSFKIDHPLDPENKYLQHSFVESPDMMNVYNGNVILDAQGEAWVDLPEYFEALNSDFRYQLTCIGGFAQVYIAEEVSNNQFKIAGGEQGMKVSWQVTGIRQDAWAETNRIEVEVEKEEDVKGSYLNPEVFGYDETRSVEYARHPEMMEERMEMEKHRREGKHLELPRLVGDNS